jgi:hypothetical protein
MSKLHTSGAGGDSGMTEKDKLDPQAKLERPLLDKLWENFREFRNTALPVPEVKGRLPIDVNVKTVIGPILKDYLTRQLNQVWIDAFKKTPGWETACLYLDICLWDPFRNVSKDNWAKTGKGIQSDAKKFKLFEDEARLQGLDVYYLLYKVLKKEILGIKVSDVDSKLMEARPLTDPQAIVTLTETDQDAKLLLDLLKVVDAHHHFAIKNSELHIYYIPSLFYPRGSGTGIGGLILHSKISISHTTLLKFQTILDSMLSKIGVFYLFENYFHQSVRSAISSIMARNMSHNMGSHVMPRSTVEAVRRRLEGMGLWPEMRGFVGSRHYLESIAQLKANWTIISNLKGNLDEYTQRKSDFLAEITTEPLMATRPAFLYREVILPLQENTLFMDNIAANEGVRYDSRGQTNRLKLRVFINGAELKARYVCDACAREDSEQSPSAYRNEMPYSLTCHRHHGQRLQITEIENGDNDVEIELPGPLGEFALYSFMENYIRNAAKHNKEQLKSDRDMEIYLYVDDLEEGSQTDYYRIRIWNNIVDPRKEVNISFGEGTYLKLRDAISELVRARIIQPDGSLKREAWGIAEMKICAVLLRGPEDYVAAVEEKENLEVAEESIFGETRLVYEFRLMRSKRLCAVLPGWEDEARLQELRQEGIWIFRSVRELEDSLGSGETLASFRFALFDCSRAPGAVSERANIIGAWPHLLSKFPFRMLVLTGKVDTLSADLPRSVQPVAETLVTSKLEQMGSYEIMQWAWRHWLRRWLDNDGKEKVAAVNIYLDQGGSDDPTVRWAKHAEQFNSSSDRVQLRVFEQNGLGVARSLNRIRPADINIIYDRHRGLRDALYSQIQGSPDWSYLLLEKQSPDFTTLFSPKFPAAGDTRHWTLPWELAEAGLLRVLVVDERAAEFSLDNLDDEVADVLLGLMGAALPEGVPGEVRENQILKWHLAWASKIYICTHFAVGQEPEPLHDEVANWEGAFPYLKVRVDKTKGRLAPYEMSVLGAKAEELKADMVLIHQGVIDEWRNRVEGFKQDEFLKGLKKHFPFVVVESGRGIPPTLSAEEKFLPFSLLQHNVLGNVVGKYGLTRILMSLARRKRNQL